MKKFTLLFLSIFALSLIISGVAGAKTDQAATTTLALPIIGIHLFATNDNRPIGPYRPIMPDPVCDKLPRTPYQHDRPVPVFDQIPGSVGATTPGSAVSTPDDWPVSPYKYPLPERVFK